MTVVYKSQTGMELPTISCICGKSDLYSRDEWSCLGRFTTATIATEEHVNHCCSRIGLGSSPGVSTLNVKICRSLIVYSVTAKKAAAWTVLVAQSTKQSFMLLYTNHWFTVYKLHNHTRKYVASAAVSLFYLQQVCCGNNNLGLGGHPWVGPY